MLTTLAFLVACGDDPTTPTATTSDVPPSPTDDPGLDPGLDPTDDPPTEPTTDLPPPPPPTTEPGVLTAGACEIDPTAGAPLGSRVVNFNLNGGDPPVTAGAITFDEVGFTAFAFLTGATAGPVDWATEVLVVAIYDTPSSCGVNLLSADAVDIGGSPHTVIRFTDDSFDCDTTCPPLVFTHAIAVPRGTLDATACLRVGGGCGEAP